MSGKAGEARKPPATTNPPPAASLIVFNWCLAGSSFFGLTAAASLPPALCAHSLGFFVCDVKHDAALAAIVELDRHDCTLAITNGPTRGWPASRARPQKGRAMTGQRDLPARN